MSSYCCHHLNFCELLSPSMLRCETLPNVEAVPQCPLELKGFIGIAAVYTLDSKNSPNFTVSDPPQDPDGTRSPHTVF